MTSLNFPDVNLWLALVAHEHVHSNAARRWWNSCEGQIAFCRQTQLGLLRLLSTASVMHGKPLTIDETWKIYESLFADDRVVFIAEHDRAGAIFQAKASGAEISPKIWSDAWLLAVAEAAGGSLVTFDRALAPRGAHCLLGARNEFSTAQQTPSGGGSRRNK
jgi:toxin-antitoxin system PIN domain toxin